MIRRPGWRPGGKPGQRRLVNRTEQLTSQPLFVTIPGVAATGVVGSVIPQDSAFTMLGVAATGIAATLGAVEPISGLVNQWFMDDAHVSGTTIQDSVGTNSGTSTGGVTSTPSPSGALYSTARAFDGVSGTYITLGSAPFNPWAGQTFTIGGWIWITDNSVGSAGGSNQTYVHFQNVAGGSPDYLRIWNQRDNGNGGISVSVSTTTWKTTTGVCPSQTWIHIAFSSDGTLYVNGVAVPLLAPSTGDASFSNLASLFGTGQSNDGMLNGRMYNWSLYNRVLTAAEVQRLASAPSLILGPQLSGVVGTGVVGPVVPQDSAFTMLGVAATGLTTFTPPYPVFYLEEDATTNDHDIAVINCGAVASTSYTLSAYVKSPGANRGVIFYLYDPVAGGGFYTSFDLQGVTTSTAGFGAGWPGMYSISITNKGNGWYLCTATGDVPAGAGALSYYIRLTSSGTENYTGDGFSIIECFNPSVQLASGGPNLLSRDLSGYITDHVRVFIGPDTPPGAQSPPLSTVYNFIETATIGADFKLIFSNNFGVPGTTYTVSCYAKSSNRQIMFQMTDAAITGGVNICFDLQGAMGVYSNGPWGSGSWTIGTNASITTAGNGWYFCTVDIAVPIGAGSPILVRLSPDANLVGSASFTGDGVSYIELCDVTAIVTGGNGVNLLDPLSNFRTMYSSFIFGSDTPPAIFTKSGFIQTLQHGIPGIVGTGAVAAPFVEVDTNISGVNGTGIIGNPLVGAIITGVIGTGVVSSPFISISKTLAGINGIGIVTTEFANIQFAAIGVNGIGVVSSPTISISKTLTGVNGLGVVGALIPSIQFNILGVNATGAVTTLFANVQPQLVGVNGTGAVTTPFVSISKILVGINGTGIVGTIIPSIQLAEIGVNGTGAITSPFVFISKTLAGINGVGVAQTFTPINNLLGVNGVGVVGAALIPSIQFNLNGVNGTGTVTTSFVSISKTLAGVNGIGVVTTSFANVQPNAIGVNGPGIVGTLIPSIQFNISGVNGVGVVTTATKNIQPNAIGVNGVGVAQTFTPINDLTGVNGVGVSGTITFQLISPSVIGTGVVSSPTKTIQFNAPAINGAGVIGTLIPSIQFNLNGVNGTGAVTTSAKTIQFNLNGVNGTGIISSPALSEQFNLNGVNGTGIISSPSILENQILTGVNGAGIIQSFTFTEQFNLNGINGEGIVGTVIPSVQSNLNGVNGLGVIPSVVAGFVLNSINGQGVIATLLVSLIGVGLFYPNPKPIYVRFRKEKMTETQFQ